MKKLLPLFIIPIMISCVSQKKYAALEEQNSVAREYDQKLDEILQKREDLAMANDQQIEYELKMKQLLNEKQANDVIEKLVLSGRLDGMQADEIREEIIRASEEQSHRQLAETMTPTNPEAGKASIEIEAMTMLISDRIQRKHQEVRVEKETFSCDVIVPNDRMFNATNGLSAAGNDIVNSLRQIVDFKEDYSIEVEISATEEGITEDQRKQANAIIEALSNYKGRNKVDIEVEFVFNGNADEIKLVVEM
jgi:hypothetical protein